MQKLSGLLLVVLAGCAGAPVAGDICEAGQVNIEGVCRAVCNASDECTDTGCCIDGICTTGCSTGAPNITSINGTGAADATENHASNHVVDRLVLTGANLLGAAVRLTGGGFQNELLEACDGASATALTVLLPPTVGEGTYTLSVVNQGGSCSATATLLQGEPGADGAPATAGEGLLLASGELSVDPNFILDLVKPSNWQELTLSTFARCANGTNQACLPENVPDSAPLGWRAHQGMVCLRGGVRTAEEHSYIPYTPGSKWSFATLPQEARPAETRYVTVSALSPTEYASEDSGVAVVQIGTNGEIYLRSGGSSGYVFFDGVCFPL